MITGPWLPVTVTESGPQGHRQNCDSSVGRVKLQKTNLQKLALTRHSEKTQTQLEVEVRQKTKTLKLEEVKARIPLLSTLGQ